MAQAILVLNEDPEGPEIAINLLSDRETFKPSVPAYLTAPQASPNRLVRN